MPIAVEFKGFDELSAKLKALGNAISEDILEAAVKAGARIARDEAERRAPRSTRVKEHMADNIVVTTVEKSGVHCAVKIEPRPKFFYWRFLEYGTSKMDAKSFLRPAVDEKRDDIVAEIAWRLRKAIEKVTR